MKRRVCVVVTARPSYSRIKSALQAVRAHPDLELQLVVAASALLDRYGNTVHYIRQDGFEVAAQLYMVLEGANPVTMAKTAGLGLLELPTVLDSLKSHVVVTIADRYETIATAIAAAYMNIPLAHVQGGEITGSVDEKVRHAVTKLANLHFVATPKAAQRVIQMGEDPSAVHVTGCPSVDLAAQVLADPAMNFDPYQQYGGVGERVDLSNGYLVVMQHPVTTEYVASRMHITETLRAVHELAMPTVWFWPNVDAGSDGTSEGIRAFRESFQPENVHFFKNMLPEHFLRLLCNSRCIIGNSSVAIRECSFMGVPAVNIGTRQFGRERGKNVLDVDYARSEIVAAVQYHLQNGKLARETLYGDGCAGERMADLLATAPLTVEKHLAY